MNTFVKVVHGEDAAQCAYDAIAAVCKEDVTGKKILLKVNTGFKGPARSALCTNPDVVEGLIRFFQDRNAGHILVGDSSIVGVDSAEALEAAGITAACAKYPGVECRDLNSFDPVETQIPDGLMVNSIIFTSALFDSDIVVTVPVVKTHMYAGVTLSIKNMKGTMYKREKTKLHRLNKPLPPDPEGRVLDYGLRDLAKVCYADYAVVDGTYCMEGFGPSGGEIVKLNVVLASKEPVAADMATLKLMQIPLEDVGHVRLIAKARGVDYDTMTVEPSDYEKYGKKFVTADEARLGLSCDKLQMCDESACSACHAALVQFLRYHTHEFENGEYTYQIFAGKDVKEDDIRKAEHPILVGNCTAKFRDLAPFCKGCPPIPSEVTKTIKGEAGLKLTYLGHSCFLIQSKEYTLIIDPFLTGNALAAVKADDVKATHMLISHAHSDHMGDADSIAERNQSVIFCTPETGALLSCPHAKQENGQPGGSIRTDFGAIKFLAANHGSGAPGGVACGFLITIEEKKIYFAGDTSLIPDMAQLCDEHVDVALLPIGDRFTMGPEDAMRAAQMIQPKQVVPMHYNTFPFIVQDPQQFKRMTEEQAHIPVTVLEPGASLTL